MILWNFHGNLKLYKMTYGESVWKFAVFVFFGVMGGEGHQEVCYNQIAL
jgi:hypothetical protein